MQSLCSFNTYFELLASGYLMERDFDLGMMHLVANYDVGFYWKMA